MSKRKPHNDHAGYVAMRRNAISGGYLTIYESAAQGIDTGGDRYAIVCSAHGTLTSDTSIRGARIAMKNPEWCEQCLALKN